MHKEREERECEVLSLVHTIFKTMQESKLPHLMQIDLSMAQLRTLFILAEGGPMTIGQVANKLSIGQSTAGHLVDRLVRAGYAQRAEDAADRRRIVAHLTETGQDLLEQFRGDPNRMRGYLREMNDDDLEALCQGLNAFASVVSEHGNAKHMRVG
ncbi:MarR family transcriptional regulator [Ktedonosporobacter rubrisoli]|uniref:MarR family transcriptional regulator n=1 Tax=Ktedonosporobacter rubrisoli TaxID=2509675 RepID=A0A4P6JYG4_KTERU|nr:MarR family transcriptional regulator [Ktedonosporobacter rubrisoli]QBD80575.1 MarR family transcriptional regulator [Ktedonosporobacter rubrisoli]